MTDDDPTTDIPRVTYFGEPWGAPITDDPAQQVPPPVGEPCSHCDTAVIEGEQGLMYLHIGLGLDGKPEGRVRPVHRECHLRTMFGALFGPGTHQCDDGPCADAEPGSEAWREEGRKVAAWIDRRRR